MRTEKEILEYFNGVELDETTACTMAGLLSLKGHLTSKVEERIFSRIRKSGISTNDFKDFVAWFEGDTVSDAILGEVKAMKSKPFKLSFSTSVIPKITMGRKHHIIFNPLREWCFADTDYLKEFMQIGVPSPAFKVGDKVRIKKELYYVWTIVEVIMPTEEKKAIQYKLVRASEEEGHRVVQCVREGKIEKVVNEQVFRVGDWVRCSRTDKVFRIANVGYEGYNKTFYVEDDNRLSYRHIEPYQPKEGEFVHVEGDGWKGTYLFKSLKSGWLHNDACYTIIGDEMNIPYLGYLKTSIGSNKITPATNEQKQALIKAVEENYSKTYCEETKEWVGVKDESKCHSVVPTEEFKHSKGVSDLEKVQKFTTELAELINRYSLEEFFGNRPDYLIAQDMVEFAHNLPNMTFEHLDISFDTLEKFLGAKRVTSNADRFRQITEGMADLYERKNKDYGSAFSKGIERRGFGSAVDRLYDKVDRLNQLLVENKTAEVKDESVIDTLRDLANYSVMTILEVENLNQDKQCD